MTEKQMKRDIQTKKARVAYLVAVVRDIAPRAAQRFAYGFFTSAAEDFKSFADHAEEIARLHSEIVQLAFDLEGLFPRQTELPEPVSA
jgi:hypothetical protein